MTLLRSLMADAVSAGASGYWNPADKNASITLSGGDAIAQRAAGTGWVSVRSIGSHNAGKHYAEVVNTTHTLTYMVVGVCTSGHTLANFIGSAATGWGQHANRATFVDGYTNNVATNLGGTPITAGQRAYIAVDFDAGKIWFGNSVSGWLNSGNPATGANPTYTFTPGTTLYLGCSIFGTGQVCTLKNQVGENTGTIPSGFSMWG